MKQNIITNEWVFEQWHESALGDERRNRRAMKIATSMLNNPDSSLPTQMGSWASLKASYRLLNCPDVSHEKLQSHHWENAIEMASKTDNVVLFVQDTSELDYSYRRKIFGLGPIGNHRGKGLMIHSCLAVEHENHCRNILGLAHQKVWVRDSVAWRKIETRQERLNRKNEGDLWEDCLKKITSMTNHINKQWVSVGDRGNDIFSFIKFCNDTNWKYLIRACQNRLIVCTANRQDGNKKFRLIDWIRTQKSQTTKHVKMCDQEEVELQVSWGKTRIHTPKNFGFTEWL